MRAAAPPPVRSGSGGGDLGEGEKSHLTLGQLQGWDPLGRARRAAEGRDTRAGCSSCAHRRALRRPSVPTRSGPSPGDSCCWSPCLPERNVAERKSCTCWVSLVRSSSSPPSTPTPRLWLRANDRGGVGWRVAVVPNTQFLRSSFSILGLHQFSGITSLGPSLPHL